MKVTVHLRDGSSRTFDAPIITWVSDEAHDLQVVCETIQGQRLSSVLFHGDTWALVEEQAAAPLAATRRWRQRQQRAAE